MSALPSSSVRRRKKCLLQCVGTERRGSRGVGGATAKTRHGLHELSSGGTCTARRIGGDAVDYPHFTRLARRIKGLPRVRFHDLRHSHATQLLLDGVHPKAQERLGHASITTTLDLYSHVTDTMQNDAAARLDAAFQSAISRLASAK